MPSVGTLTAATLGLGLLLGLSSPSAAVASRPEGFAGARRSLAQVEEVGDALSGAADDLASQANETVQNVTRLVVGAGDPPYPAEPAPPSLEPLNGTTLEEDWPPLMAPDAAANATMGAMNETAMNVTEGILADPRNGGGDSTNATVGNGACPPAGFDSIPDFNLSAWTEHPWYIQEQMPVVYQKPPFFCVRANYEQTGENTVKVMNTAKIGSVEGTDQNPTAEDFPLKAVIDDLSDPSKLKVGPEFVPEALYGPYWVVFAGPTQDNYEYGIVSGGPPMVTGEDGCIAGDGTNVNGEGLWLFSKDPEPEEGTVQMLKDKATELGFDLSVLQPVVHEGCTYPDDQ